MSWDEYYAGLDDDDHDELDPDEYDSSDLYDDSYNRDCFYYEEDDEDEEDFGSTYPEDVEVDLDDDRDMSFGEGADF